MPLSGQQVIYLADQIDQHWDIAHLLLLATDLDINLSNLAPGLNLKQQALVFINHMNGCVPPRDRMLLEALSLKGNVQLKTAAAELMKPAFFSPTGDAHDAILLGRKAFVDRADLRHVVREFTNPSPYSTHMLVVRGDQPCGKSYTWEFLRHLAVSTVGAVPQHLQLKNTLYTPRQIFEEVGRLLRLDRSGLPAMTDEPQLAMMGPLINWLKGEVVTIDKPYWLVVDDLNDPSVTPAMGEAAYAVACAVEDLKPQNLWVALLGHNVPITNDDLLYIAQEDARFPDEYAVAEYFDAIAKAGPAPLAQDRALQIANLLFEKCVKRDKESMINLRVLVEKMGEKLMRGEQP